VLPAWVNRPDGSVFLNDLKRYVKGAYLSPAAASIPVVIAAAPSATVPTGAPPIIVESPPDAIHEIFSMFGEHLTAPAAPALPVPPLVDVQRRMTVQIFDLAWRRNLMNRDIPVDHVFGTNLSPFFLRESIFLEGQQVLQFNFLNNSTAGGTAFKFQMESRKFQATSLTRKNVTEYINDQRRRRLYLTPFWQTSNQAISIPAGGVVDVFFTTDRSFDFIILGNVSSFISTGTAGDLEEGFAVELFDAKTERPLQNQAVVRSCCSGSAGFPFLYPTGWIQEPNTILRVRFTNLITNAATEVFWTFFGVSNYTNTTPFQVTPTVAPAEALFRGVP